MASPGRPLLVVTECITTRPSFGAGPLSPQHPTQPTFPSSNAQSSLMLGLEGPMISLGPMLSGPVWWSPIVTNVTPTGVQTCHEGRNEMTSPAGRLTTCLLHVGQTSDWHECETKGQNEVRDKFEGLRVRWPELWGSSRGSGTVVLIRFLKKGWEDGTNSNTFCHKVF